MLAKIKRSTVRVSLTNQCNDRSSSPAHPLQSMAAMASSNLNDAELHLDHPGGVVGVTHHADILPTMLGEVWLKF